MPRHPTALPALCLLFNAFVWGVSWWPFRVLQGHGLHPLWATAAVYGVSVALWLALRPGALRALVAHPQLWLLAAASGCTNAGFNWAVTVGDVVRVVLLFYVMPVWSALLAWALLGERPRAAALGRTALALLGVAVVLHEPGTAFPLPRALPDWLALAAGFTFALNNVLLRRLRAAPAEGRVAAMFVGGLLLAGGAAWAQQAAGRIAAPPAPDWAWMGVAGVLALAFLAANLALQVGATRLAPATTSLLMLSEVVFASASAAIAGAAVLDAGTLAGGALVLGAALWAAQNESTTHTLPEAQPP